MPAKKPPPDEINELATALKQTLDNAERGLRSFLASLQNSGLPEATGGYRQLQALLLQQRLWTISQQRAELNGNFTRIAQLAGELHKIFTPTQKFSNRSWSWIISRRCKSAMSLP